MTDFNERAGLPPDESVAVGHPIHRDISSMPASDIAFSFCTMVTDLVEYRAMVMAFDAKGFGTGDCEFLYVDNSTSNRYDAFAAYNRFLVEAKGKYIVLCHQDILPLDHDRAHLERLLAELDALTPNWGLCGNAGATDDGRFVYRITHGDREVLDVGGPYPVEVMSLDENFIVVRRDANLALSRDLSGFHWYGADLSIVAGILGWRAFVVDFHLFHRSTGTITDVFTENGNALRRKYERAFRHRWHHVPTQRPVYLSTSPLKTFFVRALRRLGRTIVPPH